MGKQRRRNIFTLKLTDEEYKETKELSEKLGKSMADIWRTYKDFSKIFYSELTLSDALMVNEQTIPIHMLLRERGDPPLCECMRPFGELMSILSAKRVLQAEAEMKKRQISESKSRQKFGG